MCAGAEIARGLINKLHLKSVVAVGHSAGAPIVLELAARYGEAPNAYSAPCRACILHQIGSRMHYLPTI